MEPIVKAALVPGGPGRCTHRRGWFQYSKSLSNNKVIETPEHVLIIRCIIVDLKLNKKSASRCIQRELSVKTLCSPLFAEFLRY